MNDRQLLDGRGIAPKKSLGQNFLHDPHTLEKIVAANPKQAAEIESGKHQTAMWFVGQIMKEMKGKADPQSVTQVIAERFGIDPGLLQKKK